MAILILDLPKAYMFRMVSMRFTDQNPEGTLPMIIFISDLLKAYMFRMVSMRFTNVNLNFRPAKGIHVQNGVYEVY